MLQLTRTQPSPRPNLEPTHITNATTPQDDQLKLDLQLGSLGIFGNNTVAAAKSLESRLIKLKVRCFREHDRSVAGMRGLGPGQPSSTKVETIPSYHLGPLMRTLVLVLMTSFCHACHDATAA
jgi:hypothetical protein